MIRSIRHAEPIGKALGINPRDLIKQEAHDTEKPAGKDPKQTDDKDIKNGTAKHFR